MNFANFSVNRPIAVIMLILIVLLLGMVSLQSLTIDLFPELNLPWAVVITDYAGAGPQEIETMVTRPLESVLGTVSNISEINSFSMVGTSVVALEFNWGTDMNFATLEMREKIDLVERALPEDTRAPIVFKMDPQLMPVIQLAVTGDMQMAELRSIVEEVIKPRLERAAGVASVTLRGGFRPELQVNLAPEKLAAYRLSISQVVQALQMGNLDASGGQVAKGDQELLVRVMGRLQNPAEAKEIVVFTPDGAAVKLKDLAEVVKGYRDQDTFTYLDKSPSIGLDINKKSDANTVQAVQEVRQVVRDLERVLPANIKITSIYDQAFFIERTIANITSFILTGGILAMLVLFFFLRSFRTTMVIALSMPISIIATFILIYFSGLSLNMMTLGGLALGVGMMVDSSIVVLENIYRRRQLGLDAKNAAITGTADVVNPLIAATLTTVAVFLPIVFVQGMASQLFKSMALTVSFSLLASILVSLTLVPMFASRMLNGRVGQTQPGNGIRQKILQISSKWQENLNSLYGRVLVWALAKRRLVVGGVTAAFIASLGLVPFVGTEFLPRMDIGMISVEIKLPRGTAIEHTGKIAGKVEEFLIAQPEIASVYTVLGSAGGGMGELGGGSSENANILATLAPLAERDRPTRAVAAAVNAETMKIPGAAITVTEMDAYGGMGAAMYPIELVIKGDDLDILAQLAGLVKDIVARVPGTKDVKTSLEEGRPELQVLIDRELAAAYGISAAQVTGTVRAAVQGQVATQLRQGGKEIDVRVRLPEGARSNPSHLEQLMVASPLGFQVPLKELARLEVHEGPQQIERRDQTATVTVTSNLAGRSLGEVMLEIEESLAGFSLPPGYLLDMGGQAQEMQESFGDLTLALLMAIALVYMIMAAQFESLFHPLVIMFTMPTAVIGVILALAVTGRTFGITAFIGVILLAGIVVNNAIILIDYINTLRRQGMSREEAIKTAGPIRLRPILMTALTTILGLFPLALGFGEGAEAQAPLATVVIGGMVFSTFLTLVLIPVVYTLLEDLGQRLGVFIRRKTGADGHFSVSGRRS
ncbi:MAG: efflux RND transporter permease subunit [Syntrophomonadaceae bacterium]|nr:efflux RND transporter permease subunit [Syntrophomonadaceae bacterium]